MVACLSRSRNDSGGRPHSSGPRGEYQAGLLKNNLVKFQGLGDRGGMMYADEIEKQMTANVKVLVQDGQSIPSRAHRQRLTNRPWAIFVWRPECDRLQSFQVEAWRAVAAGRQTKIAPGSIGQPLSVRSARIDCPS